MAHVYFAEIDSDNIVLRVTAVPDEEEHRGQEYLADDLGLGGTWIQTVEDEYGNRASDGHTYSPDDDFFYDMESRPFPSWTVWENNEWIPPVPYPGVTPPYWLAVGYLWDEDTLSWFQPPSPEPSWVWNDDGYWEPPVPYPGELENGRPSANPVYYWNEDENPDRTGWVPLDG